MSIDLMAQSLDAIRIDDDVEPEVTQEVTPEPEPTPEPTPEPEVEPTIPDPVPEPAPQPEPTQEEESFVRYMREVHNVDLSKYGSDHAAANALVNAWNANSALAQDAELGRRIREMGGLEALQQPQVVTQQPTQPVVHSPERFKVLQNLVQRDERNRPIRTPGIADEDVSYVAQQEAIARENLMNLGLNPQQFLAPYVEQIRQQALAEAQGVVTQTLTQSQQEAYQRQQQEAQRMELLSRMRKVEESNPWIYDPNAGTKQFSAQGIAVSREYENLVNAGADPAHAFETAVNLVKYRAAATMAGKTPPPQAIHSPNVAPPVEPQGWTDDMLDDVPLSTMIYQLSQQQAMQ